MADKSWKAFERRVAAMLGTRRISAAANSQRTNWGRNAPDCGDCKGLGAYQLKLGYRMPGYLSEWLQGIRENLSGVGRIGVIVWKPKGGRDNDALVCLRLEDWVSVVSAMSAPAAEGSSPNRTALEPAEIPSDTLP